MASDQWSVASLIRMMVVAITLASTVGAQKVGNLPCEEENPPANLQLITEKHVFGQLSDPTGAAFQHSKVVLRKSSKGRFVEFRAVATDQYGKFDLGLAQRGSYRFLPGPNRGWKQPKEVMCDSSSECEIRLVLQLNPSDQPFAQCPIR